jgi:hypothetical protein
MIKSARSRFEREANSLPPSSSGLGRSPFKATTGVRIPVGAQKSDTTSQNSKKVEEVLAGLHFEQREKLNMVHNLSLEIIARSARFCKYPFKHKTDRSFKWLEIRFPPKPSRIWRSSNIAWQNTVELTTRVILGQTTLADRLFLWVGLTIRLTFFAGHLAYISTHLTRYNHVRIKHS